MGHCFVVMIRNKCFMHILMVMGTEVMFTLLRFVLLVSSKSTEALFRLVMFEKLVTYTKYLSLGSLVFCGKMYVRQISVTSAKSEELLKAATVPILDPNKLPAFEAIRSC